MEESLESLTSSLTTLQSSLAPLLAPASSSASLKPQDLSLLSRAKLNVLTAYAIESLLFSSLRLSGISAADLKVHPVATELARIKQYFAKLDEAENGRQQPRMRIDKEAAERFVRAGIKKDVPVLDKADGRDQTQQTPRTEEHGNDSKRKTRDEDADRENAKKKKKDKKASYKEKSNKVPKGPKEAFQALLKKAK
jgi:exosome complex protein LRP1